MVNSPYNQLLRERQTEMEPHKVQLNSLNDKLDEIYDKYAGKIDDLQSKCPHSFPEGSSADDGGMFYGHCVICGKFLG